MHVFSTLKKDTGMELRVNNSNNQTTFGWDVKTHVAITRSVLEQCHFKHLKKPKRQKLLMEFSMRPDLDEPGILVSPFVYAHEYHESFAHKDNAHTHYLEHIKKIKKFLDPDSKKYNVKKAMKHAGRALHFLQDISNSLHTQKELMIESFQNFQEHIQFEFFIGENRKDILKGHSAKVNGDCRAFDDIFFKSVNIAQQNEIPRTSNRNDWLKIGRIGINRAVDSTAEFLSLVSKLMDKQ